MTTSILFTWEMCANHSDVPADEQAQATENSTVRYVAVPSHHQVTTQQLTPESCDGSSSPRWTEFIQHFALLAEYNSWTERDAGLELACCFKGQAVNILSELPVLRIVYYLFCFGIR